MGGHWLSGGPSALSSQIIADGRHWPHSRLLLSLESELAIHKLLTWEKYRTMCSEIIQGHWNRECKLDE
jgi:hypothetical protein